MILTHSVTLMSEKCIGCTDCIKRCPTEAIRVHNAKAEILDSKCIDCGMCIKVCRNHAKKAITSPLEIIHDYKVKIALPAPTLYGQFKNTDNVNTILTALKRLGFDDVFEVSAAAELVTKATREYIAENELKKPIISSACPVVVRLISMNFPSLIENILPLNSPMEIAGKLAKQVFSKKYDVSEDEIGVFFLTPCPGKATNTIYPIGLEKSSISGVISISDVFLRLRSLINEVNEPENLSQSSVHGIEWALSGGETKGVPFEDTLSVDGLENVSIMLELIENGQCNDVDFIELLSCTGGCVGGPLALVISYMAKANLKRIEKFAQTLTPDKKRVLEFTIDKSDFLLTTKIEKKQKASLDVDMATAIMKMEQMDRIIERLPNIDCGSCGSPTCKSFAEDIVRGYANTEDCVFMLRKKVSDLAEMMVDLSNKMPQTFSKTNF